MAAETTYTAPSAGRLFFALWVPPACAGTLHAMAGAVVGRSGGRLMREDTLHLTLAFLGDIAERRLPALMDHAAGLSLPRVPVCLDRLGFWAQNHILFAGSSAPDPALGALADSLQESLKEAGFLAETRAFVPHVTMLRKLLHPGKLPALPAQAWEAEEFALVRSWRSDRGAAYETVARWPLQAALPPT
ncbi:MAG TPA: RNA 2',3'-cyclic phosphodiesterase [Azospira sp.]|nr:RNA 2',3'-cyclic phosphodiesterase [Azospira sp.]HNN07663.1 RNA 2',3'-cyclic phosphodiesterase [Azospira sp.]HNN44572.1 RNA 2',3'-cyclic phosphodiesterase [Azospira sp.]